MLSVNGFRPPEEGGGVRLPGNPISLAQGQSHTACGSPPRSPRPRSLLAPGLELPSPPSIAARSLPLIKSGERFFVASGNQRRANVSYPLSGPRILFFLPRCFIRHLPWICWKHYHVGPLASVRLFYTSCYQHSGLCYQRTRIFRTLGPLHVQGVARPVRPFRSNRTVGVARRIRCLGAFLSRLR